MTIEASSSGEERSRTSPSGQRLSHNQNKSNSEVDETENEISDVLGISDQNTSNVNLDITSHNISNTGANGSIMTIEVVQPQINSTSPHSPSSTAAENQTRNGNSIRKTIAKWLRLQRPNNSNKSSDVKKQNHGRSRYKLTGWPPRWVRRRSQSPSEDNMTNNSQNNKQRALPPVPIQQVGQLDEPETDTTSHNLNENIIEPDVELNRRITPEIRPEDFPPGVAYLPDGDDDDFDEEDFNSKSNNKIDFASTIKTVKNCDWYWGPICGDAAEQVLQYEPDGSFLVRDSSDDRHIFSLTFKLNGTVRHVRIEHDQGNFSFGSFTRFKSHTIVDFVENAVEHSRSGRYLFFLNRRLPNGPMRVQLLHPVSRIKKVQSLQHMCRFVILKLVPRDHVDQLPVPKRIKEYLKTPNYYSENEAIEEAEESTELSREMAAVLMPPIPETEIVSQNNQDVVVVEPAEENTNVMYLASSFQNVEAVSTSVAQGDRVVDGGVLGGVGAGAVGGEGQEDQQQHTVF